ncbi:MAG: glutathione S-transferase N-terminal domain-containing protein [Candidatus Thiodiazotropha sp. (ex Codakia rugifera)]|nr:glutathione S-transferase N-terminal domain-containing protein [Candidatus Thiodiazotropha sp. (ex Codakia rugifera)]
MLYWLLGLLTQPVKRPQEQQRQVDIETSQLALYYFPFCPYCLKVNRVIRRLNLNIERRNASYTPHWYDELHREGGKAQTPCLKIEHDDRIEWLYESDDIICYLRQRFSKQ